MRYDVTIGIPLYNSCDYIAQTMQSVLDQSYQEFEILIVDDCSTDGSLNVVMDLKAHHPFGSKIRILKQPYNLGVSATRNRIIEEASGNYLYFLDSDDQISGKDVISILVDNAKRVDADVVFGSYEKIWMNDGHKEIYQYEQKDYVSEDEFAQFAYRKFGGVQASACNCLMKLSLIRNAGLRFLDTDFLEDYMFTFDLVTYVKTVVTLPDITYFYQFHDNSLSHSQSRDMIPKIEIQKTIQGLDILKRQSERLSGKPYFGFRMCNLFKTDLYVLCSILRNRTTIVPSFSTQEMKEIMSNPLSVGCILRGNGCRQWNLFFLFISHVPAILCISIIKVVGKIKGLI